MTKKYDVWTIGGLIEALVDFLEKRQENINMEAEKEFCLMMSGKMTSERTQTRSTFIDTPACDVSAVIAAI